MEELKASIRSSWRNRETINDLIGTSCPESFSFNWGSVPTEKAVVTAENGKISRIRTYSGLSWTARGGYGSPVVDTDK